jgi:hypothetical protein
LTASSAFLAAFDALPFGAFEVTFGGHRYRVAKTRFSGDRSQKLVAEELGGNGYISFNLYRLTDGRALLKPCEMPAETVEAFVLGALPVPPQ